MAGTPRSTDCPFGCWWTVGQPTKTNVHIGGSARGYQAIFVPFAALSSPGYGPMDGQPIVYLYIAALEVNVLNCRCGRHEARRRLLGLAR
jgi:hypothetical protein